MLSGCFFIPIPIGVVYPASPYQEPDGAVTSGAEANPSASLPDDKLAAKKDNKQTAGKTKKRIECKQQAEKLLSDSDRQAYMKAHMSPSGTSATFPDGRRKAGISPKPDIAWVRYRNLVSM